jgi:hypothetical protein
MGGEDFRLFIANVLAGLGLDRLKLVTRQVDSRLKPQPFTFWIGNPMGDN